MKKIIEKYKKVKKLSRIRKKYNGHYAFVGIGAHSINNLYPVLDYLNVSLKYVVSRSEDTAKAVSESFHNTEGTTDLDRVLNDSEIKGVIISANPQKHFDLIKKTLENNKMVFVEKPPCQNLDELSQLIELEKQSKGMVITGMQKRYSPLYKKVKPYAGKTNYYRMQYFTGSYPEGDPLVDLFIHPIDLISYIFGEGRPVSIQKINKHKGIVTYLLHMKHDGNILGNIELSTDNWWAQARESLFVNTDKYLLESLNTERLVRTDKPAHIAGIPLEKIKPPEIRQKILYEQNSFLPVAEHNQLHSAGYFDEIKTFLDLCENKKGVRNLSSLDSLKNTYQIIKEL